MAGYTRNKKRNLRSYSSREDFATKRFDGGSHSQESPYRVIAMLNCEVMLLCSVRSYMEQQGQATKITSGVDLMGPITNLDAFGTVTVSPPNSTLVSAKLLKFPDLDLFFALL